MQGKQSNDASGQLSLILAILFFPFTLLCSWVIVHPQEEKIVLVWGELDMRLVQPGL